MSWRATPSRPAPPVTSGPPSSDASSSSGSAAYDSLFAGRSSSSASSSTPHRTLSSSSSAYSLLSRKMAEINAEDDDDRMSVRSGRSGVSRFRGTASSGDSTLKGRSRAASTASSVRTARIRSESTVDEDGDVKMGGEEEGDPKGKGKAAEDASPGPSSSVKRARLRPPPSSSDGASIRSRRSSWALSPSSARTGGAVSSAQPTLSTTTADDLMPSMKMTAKPHRASSVASIRSAARARPSLAPLDSGSTVKPSPLLSRSASTRSIAASAPPQPDPPSSASSTSASSLSASPTEDLPAKRGWFGRSSVVPPPLPSFSQPPTAASEPLAPLSESPPPTAPPAPPSPTVRPIPSTADEPSHATAESSTVGAAAGRGWLSLLSRSKPSNFDLAGEAAAQPAVRMDVDEVQGTRAQAEGEATPLATPAAAKSEEGTLRAAPSAESAAATVYEIETVRAAPARVSSWFTWGRSSSREAGADETAEGASAEPGALDGDSSAVVPATAAAEDAQPDLESALTPQPVPTTAEERGWLSLRSLWGAAAGGSETQSAEQRVEQRRREAWALKLAAKNRQRLLEPASAAASSHDAAPSPAERQQEQHQEPSAPAAPQNLRHKPSSSWSLFSRTPASSSPIAKSTFSLRAPLIGLGVASSAASTRSRTSSHADADTTAPSSPQLRAQSDQGPVKPLTGSIRAGASPRLRGAASFGEPLREEEQVGNLVLPSFTDTFLRPPRSFEPPRSTLTRAVSAVSAYLFSRPPDEVPTSPSPLQAAQLAAGVKVECVLKGMEHDPAERLPKALEAVGEQPRREKVKRVVTIGVHGWYSSSNMIKSVLGEQTGTSLKFSSMMHDAVQQYLEQQNVSSFNIQAIALEGQGTVEERVNKLYNQLVSRKEWCDAILKADAVFVATHSQGTVVSTQLLARMLDQGMLHGAATHLLAMCGICQGPFIYLYNSLALAPYFNYVESAPARELFEYQNPESVPSIKFVESLRLILNAGVKVTAIGSLNDQVVPLYSALFSGVSHPGILRAVFIDSDAFRTSDFLANLCVFSARLRNAGLSDHDLVYHISEALAGALTGVGHSKIYDEEAVFDLAVRYHFETTTLTEAPTHLDTQAAPPPLSMSFNPRDRRNPYLATWALRGIIEDSQVRELFGNELVALQEAYETWKPQTKVLKDVKLKLEGIRMLKKGKL
ncbi:hypothetical protein JCM10213_002750 [Rhodosporidiobolus nylandii]